MAVAHKALAPVAGVAMLTRVFGLEHLQVAEDAMQIHGAYSCSDEYEIGRFWRDAKFMQTIEGAVPR